MEWSVIENTQINSSVDRYIKDIILGEILSKKGSSMVALLLPVFLLVSPEIVDGRKLRPIQTGSLKSIFVWFVGSTSVMLFTRIGGAAKIFIMCLYKHWWWCGCTFETVYLFRTNLTDFHAQTGSFGVGSVELSQVSASLHHAT